MKTFGARPADLDYRAELERRFGRKPAMCEMDSLGGSVEQRKPYQVAEGIAIIQINGVLTNDPWWWDETDYGTIQNEVRMAGEDADVTGILLRVNSPGGETDSAFETVEILAKSGKKKPIWAIADPIAYSAGYLLASVAERIYTLPTTGGVGSIGVYAAHFDLSGMLEKAGVKVTLISAGKGKTDANPYQPLGDSARKTIEAEVQRLYGEFVGTVARNRKMPEGEVRKLGAQLFHGGQAAIGSGLADRAGMLEEAWVEMASAMTESSRSFTSVGASASATSIQEGQRMSDIKADATSAPAPVTAPIQGTAAAPNLDELRVTAEAVGFAHAAEIVDLCALAGHPQMAGEFISARKPLADVRRALMAERTKDGGEIHSHTMPETGTKATKPADNIVVAACERIAAQMKGGA